jgi:hypothetical protein
MHPPIFHENKIRTIAKADVAEDLKLWMARPSSRPKIGKGALSNLHECSHREGVR